MLSNNICQAVGGGGSVTSDEVSAVSAQAASMVSFRVPVLQGIFKGVCNVQSTTNSALTDISGLVLTVAAEERWRIEGQVAFSTSAATAGLRVGWSVPPLSTPRWTQFIFNTAVQSAAVAGGAQQLQVSGASVGMSITSTSPAGGILIVDYKAILDVASAGTVRLKYAGILSTTASPVNVMPGSYMLCYRLK